MLSFGIQHEDIVNQPRAVLGLDHAEQEDVRHPVIGFDLDLLDFGFAVTCPRKEAVTMMVIQRPEIQPHDRSEAQG